PPRKSSDILARGPTVPSGESGANLIFRGRIPSMTVGDPKPIDAHYKANVNERNQPLYAPAGTSKSATVASRLPPPVVPLARSPSDTTPTRRLSWFTTGRRRIHHSPIFCDTSETSLSSKQ